jgi:phosphoenolpyruvate carboxylase
LQQVDLGIARQYVKRLKAPLHPLRLIEAEYALTLSGLKQLLGEDLLASEPQLKASVELKTPYLDPLNYIQVRLLEQYRYHLLLHTATKAEAAPTGTPLTSTPVTNTTAATDMRTQIKEACEQAIMSSITGVAIGLGTTG